MTLAFIMPATMDTAELLPMMAEARRIPATVLSLLRSNLPNHPSRDAASYTVWWNISGHNRLGSNYGIISGAHPFLHNDATAQPHILPYVNWFNHPRAIPPSAWVDFVEVTIHNRNQIPNKGA